MYDPKTDTYTEDFLQDITPVFPVVKPIKGITEQKLNAETGVEGVLTLKNTVPYSPTSDYHPATRKFVIDRIAAAIGP